MGVEILTSQTIMILVPCKEERAKYTHYRVEKAKHAPPSIFQLNRSHLVGAVLFRSETMELESTISIQKESI